MVGAHCWRGEWFSALISASRSLMAFCKKMTSEAIALWLVWNWTIKVINYRFQFPARGAERRAIGQCDEGVVSGPL